MFELILVFLSGLIALLLFRYITYRLAFSNYVSFCMRYCYATKRSTHFLKEVVKVWPMMDVVFDLGYWKVEKYIINQDMYIEMMEDLEKQAMEILKKLEKTLSDAQKKLEDEKNHKN